MIEWRLLYVDDDEELITQVKSLENRPLTDSNDRLNIEALSDFDSALNVLEAHRYDILILDVRLNLDDEEIEDKGRKTLEIIREKRFIPVIFYTAVSHIVRDLQTPLVRVVDKSEGLRVLRSTIEEILETRIPAVNRALIHHFEAVQRDYMWDFIAEHWPQINTADGTDLAYLLARRLALSLSGHKIQDLARHLGNPVDNVVADHKVHPMRYYIVPPVEVSPMAGDIYRYTSEEMEKYFVVLTPSCDLVLNKAEMVILASCLPLEKQPEYTKWYQDQQAKNPGKLLKSLLTNNRKEPGYQPDRYYYLPGVFVLPHLIVDFQQLTAMSRDQLNGDVFERVASLDNPFAEEVMSRFIRYFGRLGTPDLDIDGVLSKLGGDK